MLFSRRDLIISAAAAGALPASLLAARSDETLPPAITRAHQAYDAIFEAILRQCPEMATDLALDTGARRHLKGRLNKRGPDGRLGIYAPIIAALPVLRRLPADQLPAAEQARLATIIWLGEQIGAVARHPYGAIDGYDYPVPYVLSQLTGSYQRVPDFLTSKHSIDTADDAATYLARLEEFARNVELECRHVADDARRGVVPPLFVVEKTIAQTEALLRQKGMDSRLVQSLSQRTRAKGLKGDWSRLAISIVDGPLATALRRQLELLQGLRSSAGAGGASTLPEGEDYYQRVLRFHTTTNLTPTEAHALGAQQVAQLSGELDSFLRAEGLTQGSVGARLSALGRQEKFLYPNDERGRETLLRDLVAQIDEVRTQMASYFNRSPRAEMIVRRVPLEIELGAPRGYAIFPSLDGSRPGAYYINLSDTRIWPRWALPTLTYHEAVPGHLWQGSIARENPDLPLLHRSIGISAYIEGWGLYAEKLADEAGLYANAPFGRIGMLQSFLYRAARIVVDTGIHSQGWSRAKAVAYFDKHVGLDPLASQSEIDRYFVWPGQATSYKIGQNELLRLREWARVRLGDKFDIKGFHDAVLLGGSMPLEVLEDVVTQWVAKAAA